jgi:hypothetical protein
MSAGWLVVIAVVAVLTLAAGAMWLARGLRRQVCLRRPDCCGRGCGCLFPVKRD